MANVGFEVALRTPKFNKNNLNCGGTIGSQDPEDHMTSMRKDEGDQFEKLQLLNGTMGNTEQALSQW